MIGMGLSLTVKDFLRVVKFPKAVFVGLLNQIILLPLIAFGLTQLFEVSSDIAIGVMILSACPGGPTSNLVTHLAKGDTALSVTLTAVNSIVTIITIPIIVNFAVGYYAVEGETIITPLKEIIGALLIIIVIPLSIGMLVKVKRPLLAEKLDKPVRIASVAIIVIVILGIAINEKDQLLYRICESFAIVFTLNVSTMILGFFTAKLFKLNFKQALTICLESGNQNGTLAIQLSSLINIAYGFPAAIYSLFMYVTAGVPILIGIKKAKKSDADELVN
jgi:BASS family bile acid:Na+ symporter